MPRGFKRVSSAPGGSRRWLAGQAFLTPLASTWPSNPQVSWLSHTGEGPHSEQVLLIHFLDPVKTDRSGQMQPPTPIQVPLGNRVLTKSLQHPQNCTFSSWPPSKPSRTSQDNALTSKTPSTAPQAKPGHHRAPPRAHKHLTPERCPSAT